MITITYGTYYACDFIFHHNIQLAITIIKLHCKKLLTAYSSYFLYYNSNFLLSLHILLKKENHVIIVLQNGIAGFCSVPRNTIWYRGKAKYGTGQKKPLTCRLLYETVGSRFNITLFSF